MKIQSVIFGGAALGGTVGVFCDMIHAVILPQYYFTTYINDHIGEYPGCSKKIVYLNDEYKNVVVCEQADVGNAFYNATKSYADSQTEADLNSMTFLKFSFGGFILGGLVGYYCADPAENQIQPVHIHPIQVQPVMVVNIAAVPDVYPPNSPTHPPAPQADEDDDLVIGPNIESNYSPMFFKSEQPLANCGNKEARLGEGESLLPRKGISYGSVNT